MTDMRIVVGYLPAEPRVVVGVLFPKIREQRKQHIRDLMSRINREKKVPPAALIEFPVLIGRAWKDAWRQLRGVLLAQK